MGKLSNKQRVFVAEYLKDKNATRAAKAAGYSKNSAQEQSSQLLSKLIIQEAVEAGLQKQLKRAELTGDMIIAELRRHAFGKLRGAFDKEGNMLHPKDMPSTIREVEVDLVTRARKVKMTDKVKALELLGKHFKLFTEVHEGKIDTSVTLVSEADVKAKREKIKGDC